MADRRVLAGLGVVVLLGVGASALGANAAVRSERRNADLAFAADSSDVAAQVRTEIRRVEDLSQAAQAFVRRTDDLSSSQLAAWMDDVDVAGRFPAVDGLALVSVVDDADLPAHIARVTADAAASGRPFTFTLDPATREAAYCLQTAASGTTVLPLARNMCPGASAEAADVMRSFDRTQMVPNKADGRTVLSIGVPLYKSVDIPATSAERVATFIGHVGLNLDPAELLAAAVRTHPDTEASLDFSDPSIGFAGYEAGTFRTGVAKGAAESRAIELGNGWRVVVSYPKPAFGVLVTPGARLVLVAGSVLSLLVVALLYVLATGRARALRLVDEKTGELSHQALHDSLTGLANRALLVDRVDQLLARARRNDSIPACLFLDLDGFKNINDTLGHEAGDILLRSVAARLVSAVRGADTIARIGGDEFVVLLDSASLAATPELVAERLVDVLRQPFDVEGVNATMRVTASVGVASGVRPGGDDLLRDADFALYEAKAAGRNQVMIFREEMQVAVRHGVELEFDLRVALERDEFRLAYQPIYNLGDMKVVGFEALLRWEHPTLGRVMPDEFISLLERSGQIVEVGRWVLHEACEQMARWRRAGSAATISVNVAARQFENRGLVGDVRAALDLASLDPAALTLEITETSLMRNVEVCVEQLVELRSLGVHVAIDDFGTGYSSLASLQRLPVDSLKIDRSFVAAMSDGPEAQALVHTIIQLGRDLGLQTLAEGVETAEQATNLRGDAVLQAQGFLFAHPLDPAEVERTILHVASSGTQDPHL